MSTSSDGDSGSGDSGSAYLTVLWNSNTLSNRWSIDKQGVLQKDVNVLLNDGTISINILKGTKILDSNGKPLAEISVAPINKPADPPAGYHIITAFDFNPNGAKFDPGITITLAFDSSEVASGETVVIAFYNEAFSAWEFIKGTVNSDNTVTFTITHFSVYAVMAGQSSMPAPTPTLTPITTSKKNNGGIGAGGIAGIVIGISVVLAVALLLVKNRRRFKKA
jgi:hypothetical protein